MIDNNNRRWSLIFSGALLLVVALVISFGWATVPPPAFPKLSEEPDPSINGKVAYIAEDLGGEACLYTVPAAGGEPTDLLCDTVLQFSVTSGWTASGAIILETTLGLDGDDFDYEAEPYDGPHSPLDDESEWLLVRDHTEGDPVPGQSRDVTVTEISAEELTTTSGRALSNAFERRDPTVREDGAEVISNRRGNDETPVVVVRHSDGKEQTILEGTDGGERYWFFDAQWSPDGKWVLVADSAGRLLIVGADGDPGARVLVDHKDLDWSVAWYQPGEPRYTVPDPKVSG